MLVDLSTIQDKSQFEPCLTLADDDSEPILGQWLEETLSPNEAFNTTPPPPPPPRNDALSHEGKRLRESSVGEKSPSFVPDKREPEGVSVVFNINSSFFFY